jgi:hypothetical protein
MVKWFKELFIFSELFEKKAPEGAHPAKEFYRDRNRRAVSGAV